MPPLRAAAWFNVGQADGQSITAIDEVPEFDLALLHCANLVGPAFTTGADVAANGALDKGVLWTSDPMRGAVPLRGPLQGIHHGLHYVAPDGREYALNDALVLGENKAFAPGFSGAQR
jgi:hypothetical protein